MPGRVVYEGKRINYFTVISREYVRNKQWYFLCKCDCGKKFYATISDIRKRKSCGCMSVELSSKANTKHGGCGTKIYNTWLSMKSRCYNPNNDDYNDYGGRGIIVCNEWLNNFESFRDWSYANGFEEMASKGRCSIDRIDVNGNYEPSNCRWADDITQANNRRSNVLINHNGETHTRAEWARDNDLGEDTIVSRLKNGWDLDKAINTPIMYDKERSLNKILDILKSNKFVTYNELTNVCTKALAGRYIKELIDRGYPITRKKELMENNGNKRWHMVFSWKGE